MGGWVSWKFWVGGCPNTPLPPLWGWDNSGSLGVMMHGMAGSDIHRLSCLSQLGLSPMLKMVCCALILQISSAPPIHHLTQAVATVNRLLIWLQKFC